MPTGRAGRPSRTAGRPRRQWGAYFRGATVQAIAISGDRAAATLSNDEIVQLRRIATGEWLIDRMGPIGAVGSDAAAQRRQIERFIRVAGLQLGTTGRSALSSSVAARCAAPERQWRGVRWAACWLSLRRRSAGRRRLPATTPEFHVGRLPGNKGQRHPGPTAYSRNVIVTRVRGRAFPIRRSRSAPDGHRGQRSDARRPGEAVKVSLRTCVVSRPSEQTRVALRPAGASPHAEPTGQLGCPDSVPLERINPADLAPPRPIRTRSSRPAAGWSSSLGRSPRMVTATSSAPVIWRCRRVRRWQRRSRSRRRACPA